MHRFIPDPGQNPSPTVDPDHLAAVKRWTRDTLRLPDDTIVTLHETACVDPGCPLVESIIAVFDADRRTRTWRFTRPRAALTRLMVTQTLATAPDLKTSPRD